MEHFKSEYVLFPGQALWSSERILILHLWWWQIRWPFKTTPK